jgi:hypothetical protein
MEMSKLEARKQILLALREANKAMQEFRRLWSCSIRTIEEKQKKAA